MKKSILLFALILGLMPSLFAQEAATKMTVDEIVDNYIEAIGGVDAWKAVKNMKTTGKMAMMGMDMPMKVTLGSPNMIRIDVDVMGQQIIQAFDGETAWQVMPMMGINKPTKMAEEEAKQVNQTELLSEFIDYTDRGYTVEMVDAREIEGVATQGLRLTDGKDKDQTYYFDLENFVPIMMEIVFKDGPMKGSTMETYFSDYQEVEGGVILPFYTEIKMPQGSQKMMIESVEANVELEEGFFSIPK